MARQVIILKTCLLTKNSTTKAKNISAQCLFVSFIFSLIRQYNVSHFEMLWRISIT